MVRFTRRQAISAALSLASAGAATSPRWQEHRRWPAPEANQGVACDDGSFYAIDNHAIGKYDKKTGARLAEWRCDDGKPLIHLDSGVVRGGTLYCAHSNYPGVPMVSSIEMWDAATLRKSGSFSFGIFAGSATWVDFHQQSRFVTFAHYRGGKNDEPDRDSRWTTLIEFDNEWQRRQGWVYPEQVVSRLGAMSISGGVMTPGGKLLCTGHDNPEIYVLRFPDGGSTLVLEEIIPTTIHGQGIALDPSDAAVIYGIDRGSREIIAGRLAVA